MFNLPQFNIRTEYENGEQTAYGKRLHEPILFFRDYAHCTVPGKPFAKQRPRASRRGSFMKVYTPKETINYENLVKYSYFNENGEKMLEGPLRVDITATFPIPTSISKKQQLAMANGLIPHIKRPDCDNIAKACLDGLNNVAFKDDSQIVELNITKQYGNYPNVHIEIISLNQEE